MIQDTPVLAANMSQRAVMQHLSLLNGRWWLTYLCRLALVCSIGYGAMVG